MNERIKQLAIEAGADEWGDSVIPSTMNFQKFAELIIKKVLDEVAERAYCSGERAWSDELDRPWVELEFGVGKLTELKK